MTSHGCDERNCGGAVRVNCGTEQVRWPLKDDTAVYELQLTLCRHSATSNGCDERFYGTSACNCETLAYSGAIDRRL